MWQVYFGDNLSIGIEFNPPSLRFRASSCISDAKVLQKTEKKEESERIFSFLMLKELHNYIYQSLIYDFVVMS